MWLNDGFNNGNNRSPGMVMHRIGQWEFWPDDASLKCGNQRRRIEHRAAKVLEVLHERRGMTVSSAELIDAVWGGRSVSQNSLSVVIGDLRRALGDSSREPSYIETIPKRGYRLIAETDQREVPAGRLGKKDVLGLTAGIAGLVAAVFVAQAAFSTPQPVPIAMSVQPFTNATGNTKYDSLAPALTDYATGVLGSAKGIDLLASPRSQWRLSGRIVDWNGQASLSMQIVDNPSRKVVLNVIAVGPPSQMPRQLDEALPQFQKFVRDFQHGEAS